MAAWGDRPREAMRISLGSVPKWGRCGGVCPRWVCPRCVAAGGVGTVPDVWPRGAWGLSPMGGRGGMGSVPAGYNGAGVRKFKGTVPMGYECCQCVSVANSNTNVANWNWALELDTGNNSNIPVVGKVLRSGWLTVHGTRVCRQPVHKPVDKPLTTADNPCATDVPSCDILFPSTANQQWRRRINGNRT